MKITTKKQNRLLALLMVLTMLATLVSSSAFSYAETTPTQNTDGAYVLENANDLIWYSAQTNVSAVLAGDIDLTGKTWTSIPALANATLDGNGHKISGLTSPLITSLNDGATVKNLSIDCTIKATEAKVGAIACTSVASGTLATIENCKVNGSIDSTKGTLGGIIGESSINVINCTNNATINISGNASAVGGIVGKANVGTVVPMIKNCENTGAINMPNASSNYSTAGIAGIAGDIANNITVESCYNKGIITLAKGGAVGGIVGQYRGSGSRVKDCYNIGNIIAGVNTGGISGAAYTSGNIAIENSYNAGTITGDTTTHSIYGKSYGVCTNVYALEGTSTNPVTAEGLTDVTAEQLKGLAITLGSAFKADDVNNTINNGYPVLVNAGTYPIIDPNQEAADTVIEKIDAIGTVTTSSEAAIKSAKEAFDALTDAQKALVTNKDILDKAEEQYKKITTTPTLTIIAPIENAGDFTEVTDSAITVTKGDSTGFTVKIENIDLSKFTGAELNGELIDEKYYTKVSGSIILKFSEEYINSLGVGSYTLRINTTEGYGEILLKVETATVAPEIDKDNIVDTTEKEEGTPSVDDITTDDDTDYVEKVDSSNVKTGDTSTIMVWLVILLLTVAASGIFLMIKRKEK